MQIVIEIPNEDIPKHQEVIDIPIHFMNGKVCEAGGYGFDVLPKGHGRLIDKDHMIARLEAASKFYGGENADAFDERFSHGLKEAAIKVAEEPTIIEADKENEEQEEIDDWRDRLDELEREEYYESKYGKESE